MQCIFLFLFLAKITASLGSEGEISSPIFEGVITGKARFNSAGTHVLVDDCTEGVCIVNLTTSEITRVHPPAHIIDHTNFSETTGIVLVDRRQTLGDWEFEIINIAQKKAFGTGHHTRDLVSEVQDLCISPRGTYTTLAHNTVVELVDNETGSIAQQYDHFLSRPTTISWNQTEKHLATHTHDGSVFIWDATHNKVIYRICVGQLARRLELHPFDCRFLIEQDYNLFVIDPINRRATYIGPQKNSATFSHDGTRLLVIEPCVINPRPLHDTVLPEDVSSRVAAIREVSIKTGKRINTRWATKAVPPATTIEKRDSFYIMRSEEKCIGMLTPTTALLFTPTRKIHDAHPTVGTLQQESLTTLFRESHT